jgi:spore coat protein U-like protein
MSTAGARFIAAVLIALAAGSVQAATSTTTFQVTATVLSSCSVSATNLAFGTYDPLAGSPTDGSSTVTVQCTLLAPFNIGLNAGVGSGATVSARIMTSGANTLAYSLYQDASRATVWGNTPVTDTVSGTGTGVAVPFTVYGRIPNGQNAAPGSYADTITVTVNF